MTIIQKATASGQITWMADGEYGGGGKVCLYPETRGDAGDG